MGLAQRKNAIYLHPKNSQLQFDTTRTYINLENLFNGEPTLSKIKFIYYMRCSHTAFVRGKKTCFRNYLSMQIVCSKLFKAIQNVVAA